MPPQRHSLFTDARCAQILANAEEAYLQARGRERGGVADECVARVAQTLSVPPEEIPQLRRVSRVYLDLHRLRVNSDRSSATSWPIAFARKGLPHVLVPGPGAAFLWRRNATRFKSELCATLRPGSGLTLGRSLAASRPRPKHSGMRYAPRIARGTRRSRMSGLECHLRDRESSYHTTVVSQNV